MSWRPALALAIGVAAAGAVLIIGEKTGIGLAWAAFLLVVLGTGSLQARHELTKAAHPKPARNEMTATARKQAELVEDEARKALALRAQRLTHLEQLERYLADRRHARGQGNEH